MSSGRLLGVLGIFLLLSPSMLLAQSSHEREAQKIIVIAHRGASGYLPEHTQEAVVLAHAQGADFIEQDVVLSKDDVPMVLHDIHLDTVTDVANRFPDRARADGRYYARDFTAKEIQSLNASERFSHKTKQAVYPSRFTIGKGHFRVPSLEDELSLIQGLNRSTGRDVGVYVEVKSPAWHREQDADISAITIGVLKEFGYDSRDSNAYVQCFDAAETRRIRDRLGCKLRLIQLIGGRGYDLTPSGMSETATYADGIGPSLDLLYQKSETGAWEKTRLIDFAHAEGLEVHPYTVRVDALPRFADSFDQLMSLLIQDSGIDGVFTDFPDRTIEARSKFARDALPIAK